MATHFFDVHNNDIMGWGFSHKPLAGYFHFLGNLLSSQALVKSVY